MDRLIYADKLKEAIEKHKNKSPQGWASIFECCEDGGIDISLAEIDAAEPVDAVPMSWLEERSELADSEVIRAFLKAVILAWKKEQKEKHDKAVILAWKEEQKEKHEALNAETKNINDTIGARLRSARLESGLSSDAAAKKTGVTRWTLNAWERDDNIPSGYNIISLCKAYNVSSDWILFGKEWRPE